MNNYDIIELLEKIRYLEEKVQQLEKWQRNKDYLEMMENNKKDNKEK